MVTPNNPNTSNNNGGGCTDVGPHCVKAFGEIMDGYDPSKNTTVPIMTRFERAKVLGMRTEQLARGAEPMIDVGDWNGRSPSDVAEEELAARATPFVLVRPMPNGKRELWRIRDLVTTLT